MWTYYNFLDLIIYMCNIMSQYVFDMIPSSLISNLLLTWLTLGTESLYKGSNDAHQNQTS